MITTANLQHILAAIGFTEKDNLFTKHFNSANCDIVVDFKNEKIVYPKDLKIYRETTTNFSEPENFVVLECISRLLQQGYLPHQIELEKPMPGGHDDTGGYCDILVQDNQKVPFLLLELKKADKFNQFWNKMKLDGGQLFNYYNSYRQAQALCLYTSDFVDGKVVYTSHIVSMVDNNEYLKTAKNLKGFKDMQELNAGKSAYFDVWKNTYQLDFMTKGIFEENIQPFTIGKIKLRVADLYEIDSASMQKKYNEFATIMRQYNVSGHENAFDKLVNLFLAKIVDESENSTDLKFYWKGVAQDNYYSFQDRLQQMYTKGMIEFLGEDVTYIDEETIKNSFKLFANDPDATKETILEYFRQQKFYTNNDFAFLDVHNQALFLQNIVILIKCVQMLQDIRLKTETENQFLGDLFEGFLDQGVKQSEGQFFTPMPIVKFLISSLPLEKMINETPNPLKVIDYACGAGHFLNEYGHQIKPFVQSEKLKNYYQEIYGIEKEYRLSKVAKVSAFMYGQNDINIIYGDALAENAKIKDNSFSVLVANPPYSVKGFLETLSEHDREKFQLSQEVGDLNKNNSIETFFVERAAQLLKTDGVATIILPSSILSNGNIYSKCRQILLENFHIVAIVEFGSGTFSKAGVTTSTLFLRKRDNNPNTAQHYQNRVNAWFNGDFGKDIVFDDNHLLQQYCQHVGYNFEDYKTLLQGEPNEALLQTDLFKDYELTFTARKKNNRIDTKELNETAKDIRVKMQNRAKIKSFKTLSADKQNAEIHKKFIDFATEIEKEKLYIFMLACTNQSNVLIIKSPTYKDDKKAKKAIKEFLGYEWSDSKGNEGIKYLNVTTATDSEDDTIQQIKGINGIQTPLFNPLNLADDSKLNTLIRQNFTNCSCNIPQELKPYAQCYKLPDMLDFSRTTFNKAIKLSVDKKEEIEPKWEMVRLGEVAEIIRGVTYAKNEQVEERTNNIILTADNITLEGNFVISKEIFLNNGKQMDDNKRLKKDDCFMCFSSGSKNHIGKICFIENDTNYYAGGFMGILRSKDNILPKYLFETMNSEQVRNKVRNESSGSNINNLSNSLEFVKIPLPPLPIQQEIVSACQAIDSESQAAENTIATKRKEIETVVNAVGGEMIVLKQLCKTNPSKSEISDLSDDTLVSFVEMASVSNNGYIETTIDKPLKDLREGSYTYFAENDIIIAKITPCMENGKCGIAKGLTNNIALGSSEFHVFRCSDKINNVFLFHYLNREIIRREAAKNMTGASGHRRVPIEFYENLKIPVPALSVQQEIVSKVTALEAEISAAEQIVAAATERKKKVLAKHL